MSDSNSKNNNLQGFENSWMDTKGCVWVGESFLSHDKWQIKLVSEFFPNSHSTPPHPFMTHPPDPTPPHPWYIFGHKGAFYHGLLHYVSLSVDNETAIWLHVYQKALPMSIGATNTQSLMWPTNFNQMFGKNDCLFLGIFG